MFIIYVGMYVCKIFTKLLSRNGGVFFFLQQNNMPLEITLQVLHELKSGITGLPKI